MKDPKIAVPDIKKERQNAKKRHDHPWRGTGCPVIG
jgi:hypothetical protein